MKNKFIILLLFAYSYLPGQVPDTETFSLTDVTGEISGAAQARVDLVHKSGSPSNCTVSCNGYSQTMVWNTNADLTVLDFIDLYSGSFGAVTLAHYGYGSITFTANVAGTDFAAAAITGTGNTAENLVPNYSGSSIIDLISCFNNANEDKFDKWYYPNYHGGSIPFDGTRHLLNFRNYGAVLRPPLAFNIWSKTETSLTLYWYDNSWDEDGFYIERSLDGLTGWTEAETTLANDTRWQDTGLKPDTWYYYRLRAVNDSGYSSWVTAWEKTEPFDDTQWYLPSWEELVKMYVELKAQGVGGFANDAYWSSSETRVGQTTVHGLSFTSGAPTIYNKSATARARAAHNFPGTYGQYALRSTGPEGGLIFNIESLSDGTYRYYEAYPSDVSTGCNWSNITNVRVGGTLTMISWGLNNTLLIINQTGHTTSAAKLCNDL